MMVMALAIASSVAPAADTPRRHDYGAREICRPAAMPENSVLFTNTCKTVNEWIAYDRAREGWGDPQRRASVGDGYNRTGAGINRTGGNLHRNH